MTDKLLPITVSVEKRETKDGHLMFTLKNKKGSGILTIPPYLEERVRRVKADWLAVLDFRKMNEGDYWLTFVAWNGISEPEWARFGMSKADEASFIRALSVDYEERELEASD